MVCKPVDADDTEADYIGENAGEHRDERCKQLAIVDVGNPDIENEQGDYNRKDAITEGFDPVFVHWRAPALQLPPQARRWPRSCHDCACEAAPSALAFRLPINGYPKSGTLSRPRRRPIWCTQKDVTWSESIHLFSYFACIQWSLAELYNDSARSSYHPTLARAYNACGRVKCSKTSAGIGVAQDGLFDRVSRLTAPRRSNNMRKRIL